MNAAATPDDAGLALEPLRVDALPESRLPARFDPEVAHPARVYCYWLGGKDHFPADREVAREVVRLRPEVLAGVRANRSFGRRVTGYAAAGLGIRQFLDIGTGLPAPEPVHETAQKISPACRVVYMDNDPLVLAHARAFMTAVPGAPPCAFLHGDIRDSAALLAAAGEALDLTRPVAVLLLAVLHFLPDTGNPAAIVTQLAAALAPGSLIAISHATADFSPAAITSSAAAYNAKVPCPVYPRTRDQVAALCGSLPVQHPGVVPVNFWLPSPRDPAGPAADLYGAVIRLPDPVISARTLRATLAPQERAAELARRATQYPGHDLAVEDTGNGPRYVARARDLGTHPSLVLTTTLEELCAHLAPVPQLTTP